MICLIGERWPLWANSGKFRGTCAPPRLPFETTVPGDIDDFCVGAARRAINESHFRTRTSLKYRDLMSMQTHRAESLPLFAAALVRPSLADGTASAAEDGLGNISLRIDDVTGLVTRPRAR
jgi:hypothetical protein